MQMEQQTITIQGRSYPVRLTLGALAEIEETLGTENLSVLATRLASPAAGDLLIILSVLIKAGGAEITLEELKAADLNLKELTQVIVRVFGAALAGGEDTSAGKSPAPSVGPAGAGSGLA